MKSFLRTLVNTLSLILPMSNAYSADLPEGGPLRLERTVRLPSAESVAWSPDGQRLAVQGYSPLVTVFDAKGNQVPMYDVPSAKGSPGHANVAYSPDGRLLAAGLHDVFIWDATTGHLLRKIAGPVLDLSRRMSSTIRFAFSPDSKHLAVAYAIREQRKSPPIQVSLYDVSTANTIWTIELTDQNGAQNIWTPIVFTPDGKNIVFATSEPRPSPTEWETQSAIVVLNAQTGERAKVIEKIHSNYPTALALSNDGRFVATGTDTGATYSRESLTYHVTHNLTVEDPVRVWDLNTGKLMKELPVRHRPWSLAFSPDGTYLVSGTNVGGFPRGRIELRVWKWASGELVQLLEIPSPGDAPFSMAFSPDGKRFASAVGNNLMWFQVQQ